MAKKTASASTQVLQGRGILVVQALLLLALAYIFGSLGIDSGSYWHYFFTFVSLVLAVKFLIRAVKPHGRN